MERIEGEPSDKKGKIGNINCDSPVWRDRPQCN